ncbi:head GIN domain-containing protein [uncultured Sphingomonas sp.]|uniref:head GIN domain-containing protein n=1 Tax=uncultured Sphingomonas sp. TaxID=158754 RepID=UPI0035CACE84
MRSLGLLLTLPLIACSANAAGTDETGEARGTGPSRDYTMSGFSAVDLRGSDDVEVRVGPAFSVRAQGPAKELDKLEITRSGDTLRIGRKRTTGMNWSDGEGVKVFVTMPRLAGAAVSGSGDMTVDRVEGDRFEGGVAGSGSLAIGVMRAGDVSLSVAGSGDVVGAGTARTLRMDIAGSGDIDARQLTASEAQVSVAGSGNARAVVNGPARIEIAGSGDVELGGSPRCTTSKVGSGEVRCG